MLLLQINSQSEFIKRDVVAFYWNFLIQHTFFSNYHLFHDRIICEFLQDCFLIWLWETAHTTPAGRTGGLTS